MEHLFLISVAVPLIIRLSIKLPVSKSRSSKHSTGFENSFGPFGKKGFRIFALFLLCYVTETYMLSFKWYVNSIIPLPHLGSMLSSNRNTRFYFYQKSIEQFLPFGFFLFFFNNVFLNKISFRNSVSGNSGFPVKRI